MAPNLFYISLNWDYINNYITLIQVQQKHIFIVSVNMCLGALRNTTTKGGAWFVCARWNTPPASSMN